MYLACTVSLVYQVAVTCLLSAPRKKLDYNVRYTLCDQSVQIHRLRADYTFTARTLALHYAKRALLAARSVGTERPPETV